MNAASGVNDGTIIPVSEDVAHHILIQTEMNFRRIPHAQQVQMFHNTLIPLTHTGWNVLQNMSAERGEPFISTVSDVLLHQMETFGALMVQVGMQLERDGYMKKWYHQEAGGITEDGDAA